MPAGIRVIYTYPTPLWDDAGAYASALREAAGQLGPSLTLLPVDSFSNPFAAWLSAAPLIRTKYTLLMHNDVFLLDARSHFLSELHGALEQQPEIAVAAPQIYETEGPGLLTTHLFNTNLHLRMDARGVAFVSHEVDLLTGAHQQQVHPAWSTAAPPSALPSHPLAHARWRATLGLILNPGRRVNPFNPRGSGGFERKN